MVTNSDTNKPANKKKWLTLTAVGIALLLIPRRSSRQATDITGDIDISEETKANKDSAKKE